MYNLLAAVNERTNNKTFTRTVRLANDNTLKTPNDAPFSDTVDILLCQQLTPCLWLFSEEEVR